MTIAQEWETNLIGEDRVSAIIFRDGKLLLLHRIRPEREYWVLIGGSIEEGESHLEALRREVREECSLHVTDYQFLFTIDNVGRAEYLYLVTDPSGEPLLSGPELERHGPDNQYLLTWVSRDEFAKLDHFFPSKAQEKILDLWPDKTQD